MTEKTDLKSLSYEELCDFFLSIGEKRFRAEQFMKKASEGAVEFSEFTGFSKELREKLSEEGVLNVLKIEKKQVSADGTVKYLFSLLDGKKIESVVMRYEHGLSICISTQVGCNMGCVFCASGANGKERDLLPSEILDQIIFAQKDLGERISHIVLMGMGEPLDNYENVLKFLRIVNHEKGLGIGYRHISLSSCGIVPNIKKLSEENIPLTLSVSLHAPTNDIRNKLMPINKKYPLEVLIPACREYFKKTRRRISFEYTLVEGINDSKECALMLASLLKGFSSHVNLIAVNPVQNKEYKIRSKEKVRAFQDVLLKQGMNATVRRNLGKDIDAACGQLKANA